MNFRISKVLTANDIGLTGTHQAGICVPRRPELLRGFPALNHEVKNPRIELDVTVPDDASVWPLMYIYYNNKFFGGTRNEYRLTGTTAFMRRYSASVGDELVLTRVGVTRYRMSLERVNSGVTFSSTGALILSGGWKIFGLHEELRDR